LDEFRDLMTGRVLVVLTHGSERGKWYVFAPLSLSGKRRSATPH
jgi:hypothetical protein